MSPLDNPCRTCGAKPGEPCKVTDPKTAESDRWREYRALYPHPSREWVSPWAATGQPKRRRIKIQLPGEQ